MITLFSKPEWLAFVLMVGGVAGHELWLAFGAAPARVVDCHAAAEAMLDEWSPRPVGEAGLDNAWEVFTELETVVADALGTCGVDAGIVGWTGERPVVGDATTCAIQSLDEAGAWDDVAGMPSIRWARRAPSGAYVFESVGPETGSTYRLGKVNAIRGMIAAGEGRRLDAIHRAEETVAMGRLMTLQHSLITHLAGYALVSEGLDVLREVLVSEALTLEECVAVDEAMERQLAGLLPLEVALRGERLCTLDSVQAVYTDDGRGDGRFVPRAQIQLLEEDGDWSVESLKDYAMCRLFVKSPSKAETVRTINELYGRAIAESRLSYAVRRARGVMEREETWREEALDENHIIRLVLPSLPGAMRARDWRGAQEGGTRLMVAIEAHRLRTGAWPESLEALVPRDLAALPEDPFALDGYRYRVLGEGEAWHGCRGYVLWSVGVDGVNDGGEPVIVAGEQQAFKKQGLGDFVFNLPRRALTGESGGP